MDQFRLAHCYERVMPGPSYFDSIVNMPRVYAGIDERSAEACDAFLRTIIDTERWPYGFLVDIIFTRDPGEYPPEVVARGRSGII